MLILTLNNAPVVAGTRLNDISDATNFIKVVIVKLSESLTFFSTALSDNHC